MIGPAAAAMYYVAAMGVAIGMFSQLQFRKEPGSPYRYFHVFLYALAVDSVGTAVLSDATTLDTGYQAQRLQLLGQALALGAFLDFQQRATAESRATVLMQRALSALILLIAASGSMLLPGQAVATASHALPFAVVYPEVRLSGLGYLAYGVALVLLGRGVLKLGRTPRPDISRAMFYSFALAFVCVLHDQLIRFGMIESIYLLELSSLACMLTVSLGQARRFVRESDELQRRGQDLERSHDQLQDAQDQLIQTRRLAAIGELSAVIAHEVRNPLAVIKNAVSRLRKGDTLLDDTRKELVRITGEEVQRLTRLVEDMLTYAKPLQLELGDHRPLTLVEAAIESARAEPDVGNAGTVEVRDRCGEDVCSRSDGRLIVRALANVLSNALRASADVTLTIRSAALPGLPSAGAVEFLVRDRGEGMNLATLAKAADPFFTTRPQGTGLGLAITERVLQAHGGQVGIRSASEGTEVRLLLPLIPQRRASQPPPALERSDLERADPVGTVGVGLTDLVDSHANRA